MYNESVVSSCHDQRVFTVQSKSKRPRQVTISFSNLRIETTQQRDNCYPPTASALHTLDHPPPECDHMKQLWLRPPVVVAVP